MRARDETERLFGPYLAWRRYRPSTSPTGFSKYCKPQLHAAPALEERGCCGKPAWRPSERDIRTAGRLSDGGTANRGCAVLVCGVCPLKRPSALYCHMMMVN